MALYSIISIICSLIQLGPTYVLSIWTAQTLADQQSETLYWKLFMGTSVAFMIFTFLRSLIFTWLVLDATTNMHNKMALKVLRSKIEFFDSNPIGRITSRFSKDMLMLDQIFLGITIFVTQGILRAIIVAITVSIVNPVLILICMFGIVYMVWIMKTGKPSMSDTQKLD